ncbi:glycosyltransferase family 4 protein [Dyadobacter sp. CY326]|uniref:glycosyltransferase family 4 protein n=1 Tax=Dyadobacter sp. CY326 TaxID=2907300 RepID=UPI001F3034E4|nr:glycosyltransferase family 4 protein [Dyadobacter sp. CY326]MCE7066131.1 glycosyltransferase family 4 protein [Dyadobacter sp. CY326]
MDNEKLILHISEVDIDLNGGMSRVEYHWKRAFENAGFQFIHVGPREIGKTLHKSLFAFKAYRYAIKRKLNPCAIIVHEPAAMFFVRGKTPTFIESHGIERRGWEYELSRDINKNIPLRTRVLYPIWRLLSCDLGLKKAHKLLLINSDDKQFALNRYNRRQEDIYVFKNGINPVETGSVPKDFTVLFNGSWIPRKGYTVLIEAAALLSRKGIHVKYLLIGGGKPKEEVLSSWPKAFWPSIRVVDQFSPEEEVNYLRQASIVVLPSSFEGQPLSILQAMAAGKCCITTNCCGQRDFIKDKVTGFLFEPGDSAKLAELIAQCKQSAALIEKIGNAAQQAVLNRTWENVSSEVVQFVTQNLSTP